jgi:GntR family transcriptional regulator/MocR family aminotransferase
MGTSSPELLLTLDRSKPRALRAQLEEELRLAIRSGRLAAGDALPSTRALAADLGVTRGVVVDAYDQLAAEGYLSARPGAKAVVNDTATGAGRRSPTPVPAPAVDVDFRPGHPDLGSFPLAAWGRATRAALATMPAADLGYGDPRGLPSTRVALADHLARVRGLDADPDNIVVCSGFGHGAGLVGAALRATGRTIVGVEDPGYDGAALALTALGMELRGIPVDGDGLVVDELERSDAGAVVVTPAHQSPTGVVLSAERRGQLLDWARRTDGYVLEDDYDVEYRYDRRPVGALQGVDPARVVYLGTASKSLGPGVRLGWMVVPPALLDDVLRHRKATDGSTSTILQATFRELLTGGHLDRHLRRSRRTYRRHRDALVASIGRHLPGVEVTGVAAGLQLLVLLPEGTDERALQQAALDRRVKVYPLGDYHLRHRGGGRPGVILGYGSVPPERAELGVRRLAEALASLEGGSVSRRARGRAARAG